MTIRFYALKALEVSTRILAQIFSWLADKSEAVEIWAMARRGRLPR
jgi:hypothetical protein